jgi:hypothetical protein
LTWVDLRENIQPNERGRIGAANEQHRRSNFVVYMPPPSADPSANVVRFNEAVTRATVNGYGGTIVFPPKKYTFDSTLRVRNVLGLRVAGCGEATHLEFNVPTGADWVTIEHSQNVSWGNMRLTGAGAGVARAAFALLRTNTPGSVYAPSQCHVHDVVVDCVNKAESAVKIGGVDANNDFHTFDRCVFQYYTQRGIDLRTNMQSYGNQFSNIRMYAGTGAVYGVDMGTNLGATFAWHGGFMSGHAGADFRLARSFQPVSIGGGFQSENSARFIVASGGYKQIAVRDVRWSGNALHEDGRAIIWEYEGQLLIENSRIGDGGADTPLTFDLPAGNLRRTVFRNNLVYSTAAAVFTNGVPGDLFGCDQITNENTGTMIALLA